MAEHPHTNRHEQAERQSRFVLVVDSNHRDLLYTAMILQNFGYNVTTLHRAEEALEFLAVAVPALVITEIELPGMNGLDLLKRLREDPAIRTVPVIIQTLLDSVEIRDLCSRAGQTVLIRKPVSAEDVFRAVQSSIEAYPRRNVRIRTYLKASVHNDTDMDRHVEEEFVTALSESGMYVTTLHPRPVASRHTVRFVLGHRIVAVEAEVLYQFSFGEGPLREPGMGMKFVHVDSPDRTLIREFIDEQIKKGLLPLAGE